MDEKYLVSQQRKFESGADKNIREANETTRELMRQLIFSATLFLSITPFVFNVKILNVISRHFIGISWILFFFSIIFGVIQFFIEQKFFLKWAEAKNKIINRIYSEKPSKRELYKIAMDEQKIPTSSSNCILYAQCISFFLGLSSLLIVMILIRFC